MKERSLEDYKKTFKDTDKEKIIEMNYELSKNLCKLQYALLVLDDFIHGGDE